jgi:hypothetical protein
MLIHAPSCTSERQCHIYYLAPMRLDTQYLTFVFFLIFLNYFDIMILKINFFKKIFNTHLKKHFKTQYLLHSH